MNFGEQVTHCGEQSAHWYVQDGVIRVLRWHDIDGNVTPVPHLSLGECCEELPRNLWEKIRHDFDNLRAPVPKIRTPSFYGDDQP
ncbi:hypothetical protein [Nocardia xishanensis]|uniref:hypothetical protein n=1 Tax=Nocardia xishanensis TaxID=238964 RepID=UPI00082A0C7D|nr:hypothetical protein [Nocardia xishanensis]